METKKIILWTTAILLVLFSDYLLFFTSYEKVALQILLGIFILGLILIKLQEGNIIKKTYEISTFSTLILAAPIGITIMQSLSGGLAMLIIMETFVYLMIIVLGMAYVLSFNIDKFWKKFSYAFISSLPIIILISLTYLYELISQGKFILLNWFLIVLIYVLTIILTIVIAISLQLLTTLIIKLIQKLPPAMK